MSCLADAYCCQPVDPMGADAMPEYGHSNSGIGDPIGSGDRFRLFAVSGKARPYPLVQLQKIGPEVSEGRILWIMAGEQVALNWTQGGQSLD